MYPNMLEHQHQKKHNILCITEVVQWMYTDDHAKRKKKSIPMHQLTHVQYGNISVSSKSSYIYH
jgi:GH18 family chitinase